jgi:hypothetical protein
MADLQARQQRAEETKRRDLRRVYAGAAVAVLHVLFVLFLIAGQWPLIPIAPIKKVDPLQWVTLPTPARATEPQKIKPRSPDVGTIDPDRILRLPRRSPIEEENNAINDYGWMLGRSLACGASSYEWLNTKMRAECRHKPWTFVYDRYGNLVLDVGQRPPPQEETLRPSDVQARERNTAPVCPTNIDPNAPCLSAIIHGGR